MVSRIWLGFKMLFCYLMPFLPCCPKIGDLEEGDCIFVQAFGRNSIPDEKLGQTVWEVISKSSSLSEIFTFLSYGGFDPGKANRALAKRVVRLARKYKIPIIAQWEVIYCVWESNHHWFLDNQSEIDCLWPPKQGYYATIDVKLESRERMKARGKKKPIEVCHPAMAARAVTIIWKIGVSLIIEAIYPWNFWKQELWIWDSDSIQPWTRGFIRLRDPREWWLPRECFGRFLHHPLKRWISLIPALG